MRGETIEGKVRWGERGEVRVEGEGVRDEEER